jgi:predicted transcriptional regulator
LALRNSIETMPKSDKAEFDQPMPLLDEEDSETLAAIDRGIKSADEGRVVPLQEVRQRIKACNTKSSSRKMR